MPQMSTRRACSRGPTVHTKNSLRSSTSGHRPPPLRRGFRGAESRPRPRGLIGFLRSKRSARLECRPRSLQTWVDRPVLRVSAICNRRVCEKQVAEGHIESASSLEPALVPSHAQQPRLRRNRRPGSLPCRRNGRPAVRERCAGSSGSATPPTVSLPPSLLQRRTWRTPVCPASLWRSPHSGMPSLIDRDLFARRRPS